MSKSATPKETAGVTPSMSSTSSAASESPRAASVPSLPKSSPDLAHASISFPNLPSVSATGAGAGQVLDGSSSTNPGHTPFSRDSLTSPHSVLSNPTSPIAPTSSTSVLDVDDLDAIPSEIDFSIPDDPTNIICNDDGTIRAGTLPKIVQRLTSSESHVSPLIDFLLAYRSYATPRYLLALLRRRFVQIVEGEDIKVVRLRVMLFIRQWIEKNVVDWIDDPPLVAAIQQFIASWEVIDPSTQRTAGICAASLQRAIDSAENDGRTSTTKMFTDPPPPATFPTEIDPTKLKLKNVSTLELARQWTLLEWKIWEAIKPSEFLNLAWTRKNKEELAPNIVTLTKNFNKAAGWVGTAIQRASTLKERTNTLAQMIQLAEDLRSIGNFCGLMEVLSGLGSASVYRLRKTWEALPPQTIQLYENLKSLMSPEGSFKKYREHLKNINPPTIPYLGISLTDLTFIYEGSKDYSGPGGLVNFSKCRMVSETLKTISVYQDTSYNFAVVPVIRDFLRYPTIWDDSTQYNYSLWNEPRPGTDPIFEPPPIVYVEETPSWLSQQAVNNAYASSAPKIIKEPPKEWKSPVLVIRRSILRAADLHHACLHHLYITETDPQSVQFGNVFFNAIKQLGGLEKVLATFETILASAPTTDDLAPPVASQTFISSAAPPSPRSGSRKSETLSISITSTVPEGLQKSQSASSVSPRSFSSNASADSDSDSQRIRRRPSRKLSSELPVIQSSLTPTKVRRSRDDSDTSSVDDRPPSPRSQSSSLKPRRTKSRRGSSTLSDLVSSASDDGNAPLKVNFGTLRESSELVLADEPYWPPKTKIELARRMLDICVNWGARYGSMVGPNRESKSLQLLPAWMESKLSQVDGMKDLVQSAVTHFVRSQAAVSVDSSKRNLATAPKPYPTPTVPPSQQNIRMYHPEEIARQLAIWHQTEFATFTRDELFTLSAYSSSTSPLSSTNLPPRSTYSILRALSEQLYEWVLMELMASEKSKKKMGPIIELFTEVLHHSIELNNFLAARSIYRALDKCVIGDDTILDSDTVSKKTKENLDKFVALFTHGSGFVWNQRIASTQMSTAEPPMVLPMEWLESAIAHNQTEKDWYVVIYFLFIFLPLHFSAPKSLLLTYFVL